MTVTHKKMDITNTYSCVLTSNSSDNSWFTSFTSKYPSEGWDYFRAIMDEAVVVLTITRSSKSVTVNAAIENTDYYEEFVMPIGTGTETLRAFLAVDNSYIDILPVSTEMNQYGWATFASDYPLDFTNVSGLTAYKVTGYSGTSITKEPVTTVPAGTPLLLNGTANTTYNIPVAKSFSSVSGNLLVAGTGASVGYEAGYTRYVLGVNDGAAEFQKLVDGGSSATVAAGKAYLQFTGAVEAKALRFNFDDEATAIEGISAEQTGDDTIYNLSGQRVINPTKGIYVKNGKKFIIK